MSFHRIVEQPTAHRKWRLSALCCGFRKDPYLRRATPQRCWIIGTKNERESYESRPQQGQLLEHYGAAARFEQVARNGRTEQHPGRVKSVVNRGPTLVFARV